MTAINPDRLLLPSEVAEMFRVDVKTLARWNKQGKITAIRTLGNHRRFREVEVRALLAGRRPVVRAEDAPDVEGAL